MYFLNFDICMMLSAQSSREKITFYCKKKKILPLNNRNYCLRNENPLPFCYAQPAPEAEAFA